VRSSNGRRTPSSPTLPRSNALSEAIKAGAYLAGSAAKLLRSATIAGPMSNVRALIEDFSSRLTAALETEAIERARSAVERAFGVRRAGRPPKVSTLATGAKPRRKGPLQLCPVPGCKKPAAPVFGMVCAKHKDLPKAKIKKFREARKAKKLGITLKGTKPRRGKVGSPKPATTAKPAAATTA
jgi:hypothetical protein